MANLTDKKVREIWGWTTECFEVAFKKHHPIMQQLKVADKIPFDELQAVARELEITGAPWDRDKVREQISREYEQLVCQLPTKKLQLILDAHTQGRIRRAQVTLDMIAGELMERELRGENSKTKKVSDRTK